MLRPRGRPFVGIVVGLWLLLVTGCQLLPTATPAPAFTPRPPPFVTVTSPPSTPTPTPAVLIPTPDIVVTLGEVRNLITGDPVPNARLYAGFNIATTDVVGKFRIASFAAETIRITAPGYEEGQARSQADRSLTINLVPDPQATLAIIYGFERHHEYGREYDLLHPDIQALFTRDDFIRHMEQTVNYEIAETTFGNVTLLPTWVFLGRTYTDVAVVPIRVVIRQAGASRELKLPAEAGHLARKDGFWRWFRGPLGAPTLTPSPSPTGTEEVPPPTATFQPGGYPAGTLVEVVGTAELNLRYGPGTQYAIVTAVPSGEVLIIHSEPQFSGANPWYEVEQAATGIRGWANANYIRPVSARPTRTPTPRPTPIPFPVGARVTVISPDDLNLRTGPGSAYPIVGTAPPGSILIIRSLPTYIDGNPWYAVEQEATGLLAWANGRYFVYAPPGETPTPAPTHTPTPPVATATPMPPGIRVVVVSPDDLNIRLGPGPNFPIVTTVPPGTILVLVTGPLYNAGNPWYTVAREGELPVGFANGVYLRPAPPGSGYFDLEWVPGCDPSRPEVALLLPGQDKCDPGVLTRPLSWLSNQLTGLGILVSGESIEATPVAQCTTCGIVVKDVSNTSIGWIRIGGGQPGSVWRTTYAAPATQVGPRCWLRQNYAWECR
jgi:uncharacterized protein YraI